MEDSCVVSLFMNVQTLYEQYTLCWQAQLHALISQGKLETVPFALVVTTLAMVTVWNSSHETQDSTNVRMPSNMPYNNPWWAVVVTGMKYFRQSDHNSSTDYPMAYATAIASTGCSISITGTIWSWHSIWIHYINHN